MPFQIIAPLEMPKSSLSAWRQALNVLARISKDKGIKLVTVRLHYHDPERKRWGHYHPMGYTYSDEAEITLCAKDLDTAVHEMAHVWTNQNHTDKWAAKYMQLVREYIPEDEAVAAIKNAANNYRCVKVRAKRIGLVKSRKLRKCSCPGRI